MEGAYRSIRRGLAILSVIGVNGCAFGGFVTYGSGRAEYPGYRLEYLEAYPKPGAVLAEGSSVPVRIKVRYTLQSRAKGHLSVLVRTDGKGEAPVDQDESAVAIERCVSCVTELSQQVSVPKGVWDMYVNIAVIPDGARTRSAELIIRYRVHNRAGQF